MIKNPISLLQETTVKEKMPMPVYNLVEATGMSHEPTFKYEVQICDRTYAGVAKTKKQAKTVCAQNALLYFDIDLTSLQNSQVTSNSYLQPSKTSNNNTININYVGQLNEFHSLNGYTAPIYQDSFATGFQFSIKCSFANFESEGFGLNKKEAKQDAAKRMITLLNTNKLEPIKMEKSFKYDTVDNYDRVIKMYSKLTIDESRTEFTELNDSGICDESFEAYTWEELVKELKERKYIYSLNTFQIDPYILSLDINEGTMFGAGNTKEEALENLIFSVSNMLKKGFNFTLHKF